MVMAVQEQPARPAAAADGEERGPQTASRGQGPRDGHSHGSHGAGEGGHGTRDRGGDAALQDAGEGSCTSSLSCWNGVTN